MTDRPAVAFPNYLELRERARVPLRVWAVLRLAVLALLGVYVVLLFAKPSTGLYLFWRLTVPALPLVFLIAPGVWRNVCPLAASNQAPRVLGFSRARTVPAWFAEYGYLIGVVALFVCASSRRWLFNSSGIATGVLVVAALGGAFAGGYLFKGKSGWCSSICPLYPIQRLYNQTPAVTVPNAHCTPCLGCTKNCYDFNPKAAYLSDLYDSDRYYAGYRTLFAAAMPGFVVAYFNAPSAAGRLYLDIGAAVAVSIASYTVLERFAKVTTAKLTTLFGAAAFTLFYYWVLPGWLKALGSPFGVHPPAWLPWPLRAAVLVFAGLWIYRTYRTEPEFVEQLMSGGGETHIGAAARRALKKVAEETRAEVRFADSDLTVLVEEGKTLLEIAEANRQPLEAGCRMGVCGADPVVIVDGMDNLPPISQGERATLERLGLDDTCRLACMCRVSGPITVALDTADAIAAPPAADGAAAAEIGSVVIVGNGIAGVTAAEHVRRRSPGCEIHLIGRERHNLYNRMAITRLIYGRSAMSGLYLQPEPWYEQREITTWLNTYATGLDREARQVVLATGERLSYDRLILASGSSSFVPPMEGYGKNGSFVLREAEEAMGLRAYVQRFGCTKAVVAGGGLLGLEAAYALHKTGLEVTVLERGEWLLRRQLDERGSHFLLQYLENLGVRILTRATAAQVLGGDRVEEIVLEDGRTLPADVFVVAAGIRPNVELAREAGLTVGRGIVVDAGMRTDDPAIFAAGDACELAGDLPGLWPVAAEQGRVAAVNATGGEATYGPIVPSTLLKVAGIDLLSVGRFEAAAAEVELAFEDVDGHRYRKLVLAEGKVVGGILIGHPEDGPAVTRAASEAVDASEHLDELRAGNWAVLATA